MMAFPDLEAPLRPARGARAALLALAMGGMLAGPATAQGLPPSDAAEALATLSANAPGAPATAPAGAPAVRAPRPAPVVFTLRKVAFTGPSGYFSEAELAAIVQPLLGRRFAAGGTAEVAEAVNATYAAAGIDLALAQVVRVDPARGAVTLDLFEARLGDVRYVAARASPAYLALRTGFRRGDLADTRRIASRLERLALTDGVLADAGFAPGAEPGSTDLTVTLAEPPATTTELRIDNFGETGTGALRGVLGFRLNNLTGWNDPLALDVTLSQGVRSGTIAYARTVGASGTAIGVTGAYATSDSVSGPARSSRTMSLGANIAHPLRVSLAQETWLDASAEYFDETATTLGTLSADQSGIGAALVLSGSHRWDDALVSSAAWSLSGRFGTYDDAVRAATGLGFAAIGASARVDTALGDWGWLVASGAAQYALTPDLPTRYDFAVTSPYAVPGYGIGLSQGPSGYWGRLQIEAAEAWNLGGGVSLSPYAFAALGEAFDPAAGGGWTGQGLAVSAGGGLSGALGERVSFDLQIARSFTTVLGQAPGWDIRAGLSMRF